MSQQKSKAQEWREKREKELKAPQPFLNPTEAERNNLKKINKAIQDNKVDEFDIIIAESIINFGWDFTKDFLNGEIDEVWFMQVLKASRKAVHRSQLKLIRASLMSGGIAQMGKKTNSELRRQISTEVREAR